MGFEIALRGTHRGPERLRKDPFTGQDALHAELEMSEEEHAAAKAVIAQHAALDAGGDAFLAFTSADVEIWGFDLDGGMMKPIGDLREACTFFFEVATAGRLAIQFESPVAETRAIVTTAEALAQAESLDAAAHEELGRLVLAADSDALFRELSPTHARS